MKKILLGLLVFVPSITFASSFSGRFGNDAGSFGGIVVHDFAKSATITGLEWDALHIQHVGVDVGEVGVFLGKRDVDAHLLFGPSVGTTGSILGRAVTAAGQYFDWPILTHLADASQNVHAYFNAGWDIAHPDQMHWQPDNYGLGGVLKFGS